MGSTNIKSADSAKEMRISRLNDLTDTLAKQGYTRNDQIISVRSANIAAVGVCLPIIALFVVLFALRNGIHFSHSGGDTLICIVLFVVLTVVHELIHGFVWSLFAKGHFKSIQFGITKGTPYCTCVEPLKKGAYILGSIMPGVILGIIPSLISVFCNSGLMLFIGSVMILGAGGDFINIIKMLRYDTEGKDVIIMDHPSEIGFVVFERASATGK